MPNIELHGLSQVEIEEVTENLPRVFDDADYSSKIVVTVVNSDVHDFQGKDQPFARIFISQKDVDVVLPDLKKRLSNFNLDMEVLILYEFIPKQ